MSSNVPVRRTTRSTRPAALNNKENAVTRQVRPSTRAKPSSSSAQPTENSKPPPTAFRAASSTVATRAKAANFTSSRLDPAAQGKRKREALGEVPRPAPNVSKATADAGPAGGAKGKEKAKEKFDGVVLKKVVSTTTTVRAPLRPSADAATSIPTTSNSTLKTVHQTKTSVTSNVSTGIPSHTRRTRSGTTALKEQNKQAQSAQLLDVVREEPEAVNGRDENDMAVDNPVVVPVPAPRRFTAARLAAHNQQNTHAPPSRSQAAATRRAPPRHIPKQDTIDEAEAGRAYKKRRTSSDTPEEAVQAEVEVQDEVKVEAGEQEADPQGDEWDDLDAEDVDDPLMVSEYVVEIFDYLKRVEQTTMPNPSYMESQKDLAWKMRGILTDWLIQVHSRFRLLPETLFLCVNIIDRFLSHRVVSLAKLQLVGITCMFIAAKVEEIVAPSASNFLYCADASYTEPEILQAERYILKTLEWNLSYPSPIHFLRRISKADNYDIQVRTVAKYLLEIQCLEWRLIAAPPSLMAAASIWLARLILGGTEWTANLAHYSSYAESALIPTANLMLNYILKPIRHQSFFKKYAAKRFLKSSTFVREWAMERWVEGQQVSLWDELPKLKAIIKEAQERNDVVVAGSEEYPPIV